MANSSINIDLDDPRTGLVAEALANKTCVKILSLLAEHELREVDIAKKLELPINTVEYNLNKLINSGLIEKSKIFFWSVKGKKTPTYKVANRKIIISPKRIIKGVVPAVLVSGVAAFALKNLFESYSGFSVSKEIASISSASAPSAAFADGARIAGESISSSIFSQSWVWFFIGTLFSLIIYFLWNWISGIMRNSNREVSNSFEA